MKYRSIRNIEPNVSSVCLGCMGFGPAKEGMHSWAVDYEASKEIIAAALEKGINFFDTAPVYNAGKSEETLGQALKDLGIDRKEVVLATKVYPRSPEALKKGISMFDHMNSWLDASLRRLQTDYVDLYILHMWDWNTPLEEVMDAFHKLIDSGKVKAIGLANIFGWQAAKANEIAKANGWPRISAIQNQWNLIYREDERELVRYCKEEDIVLTPYSSLAGGRLSRTPGEITERARLDKYGDKKFGTRPDEDAKIKNAVYEISREIGCSMTEVSLAWLIEKGALPICGATKLSQVDALATACDLHLSAAQMEKLEESYVPHPLSGVIAEHTPEQNAYEVYGVDESLILS